MCSIPEFAGMGRLGKSRRTSRANNFLLEGHDAPTNAAPETNAAFFNNSRRFTFMMSLLDCCGKSGAGMCGSQCCDRAPRLELSRASDTGLGGSDDDIGTWSFDVQRIDGHRSGVSTRRARLLVDDEANAAWQRDGEVRVGYDDGLARGDQADELSGPAARGLPTAAGRARVRLHDIGGNQTAQQAQVGDRRLRLTGSATARAGTLQRVSRGQAQNIDAR